MQTKKSIEIIKKILFRSLNKSENFRLNMNRYKL